MKTKNKMAAGVAIGIGLGSAIGIATDNLGLWIALGIVFGAGAGSRMSKSAKQIDEDDELE